MITIAAQRSIEASPAATVAAIRSWVARQEQRTDAWNGGRFEQAGSVFRYRAANPENPAQIVVAATVTVAPQGRGALIRVEGMAEGAFLRRDGAPIPDIVLKFAMRRYTNQWLKDLAADLEGPGQAVA